MSNESVFAKTIMEQKYSHTKKDGTKETWEDISKRVARQVMRAVNAPSELTKEIEQIIKEKKFVPGGRYLYAAGNLFHQTQNCLLLRAEDSREGWAELTQKSTMALMTGAGIGIDYSDVRGEGKAIRKTGGTSTGPLSLMKMINELGRGIMQGGSRRSAIWAGLKWNHPDIHKFIRIKNWSPEVRALKEKDFNFPADLDGTNVSVLLDDDFFKAFHNPKHKLHAQATSVYWSTLEQMVKTAEPGFSVDTGINEGETLRNACVSGDTELLTKEGYQRISNLVGKKVDIWNGFEWSEVEPKITGENQETVIVTLSDGRKLNCTPDHKFVISTNYQGGELRVEAQNLVPGMKLIKYGFPVLKDGPELNNAYCQGFISAEGMDDYKFLYLYEPKYVCLNRLKESVASISQSDKYNRKRLSFNFQPFSKMFVPLEYNLESKLEWLAGLFDGDGCELKEGGLQLSSVDFGFLENVQKMLSTIGANSKIVAGMPAGDRLLPDHKGNYKNYYCKESKRICIGAIQLQQLLSLGMKCERLLFDKNPNRDAARFTVIVDVTESETLDFVYCFNESKRHLGCFNGIATGQCTEVTSRDDSDICNLGSINLAQISSLEEMKRVTELATAFLLAGTVYSDVPYAKVDQIRTKNRRLGLGLMGIHEWLLKNGKKYEKDDDLEKYLEIYATSTEIAHVYAEKWDLSKPIKTRAIAPTGTIGIISETSTGIEPIFCVSYQRRYLKGNVWHYQYVIDPAAKRLIESGVNPENIQDAYDLAKDVEKRVAFQAWVQEYVDHGISSTINLPAWGTEFNNEKTMMELGQMLIKYLPKLRGMTVYPDGARGGQPLSPVNYSIAIKYTGEIFVEQADVCEISKGGSCGA